LTNSAEKATPNNSESDTRRKAESCLLPAPSWSRAHFPQRRRMHGLPWVDRHALIRTLDRLPRADRSKPVRPPKTTQSAPSKNLGHKIWRKVFSIISTTSGPKARVPDDLGGTLELRESDATQSRPQPVFLRSGLLSEPGRRVESKKPSPRVTRFPFVAATHTNRRT